MKLFRKEDVQPFYASKNEIVRQYTGRKEKHGNSKHHSLAVVTILPGLSSDPHSHKVAEESFLVISGSGIMEIDGRRFEVKAGDCVFVQPGETHTVINLGSEPLECVLATGPAWHPEDSF
ncbi:cupin domain-containing protein [Bdellovibrio sp. HCB288]|uniref:cupin domain-containing protein n=1 Tax=Bdellovibrio sp. HCB288 TaxID=3394355 RepID=UPI0039B5EE95